MNWYFEVLRKYADFDGRARRMEYWMFLLINSVIALSLLGLDHISGLSKATGGLDPFYTIYSLATLIPSIAVLVRRLHDINYSGLHLLVIFIPLAGGLLLLMWAAREGDRGRNDFGRDPIKREKKKKKRRIEEDEDDEDYEEVKPAPKKKKPQAQEWEVIDDDKKQPKKPQAQEWEVIDDEEEDRPRPKRARQTRRSDDD